MNDKTFELYLKTNVLIPKLSREEESDCVITIQGSVDPFLIDKYFKKLILASLRIVLSIAKKYEGMGLSLEDLVQEGYFGLCDALKGFDPYYEPHTRFTTFAFPYVKRRILIALNKKPSNIPLPESKKRAFWKLIQDPSKLEEKERDELEQKQFEFLSLDALSEIPDFERKFGIIDYRTPEDEVIEKTDEEYLILGLKKLLTSKEFEISMYLVGFKNSEYKQLSPRELANKFGLKVARIYQLRKKIKEKLIEGGLVQCGVSQKRMINWK